MNLLERFRSLPRPEKKDVLFRYVFLQIPDTLILVLVLWGLDTWVTLPSPAIWGAIAFWILKDVVLFPFVWRACQRGFADARDALIGAEGIAEEKLDPSGYIWVHGALWRAAVKDPGPAVQKGETVEVEGADGLLLTVRRKDGKRDGGGFSPEPPPTSEPPGASIPGPHLVVTTQTPSQFGGMAAASSRHFPA